VIIIQSIGFILCLVLAVAFGVAIAPARRLDRLDDYHLMHGPDSGCVECEGK
jgi:hypothetical protein